MKLKSIMAGVVILLSLVFTVPATQAQFGTVCDSGGVCGTDPNQTNDPSYSGLLAARVRPANARGSRNPIVVIGHRPETVPFVVGSQSYNKVIPILSLPGRGLDLNLTLYYNSRIWDIDFNSSAVSLNTDRDFPSYGFRLDFGYLEFDSVDGQFVLTEADGSKHAMPVTANTSSGSIYDSNDGTFIRYSTATSTLTYRNGTTVLYQVFPSQSTLYRPIKIRDRNGNFISIAYVSGSGNDQHIDSVTDTVGRVIRFVYDASNHLSQITQSVSSSTDQSGTHVWATFVWGQIPLTYNFASSLTVVSSPPSGTSVPVLKQCIYPNGTGVQFSYGAWGIVNRIDLLSSSGLSRAYETYNYPDASQPLSDAPQFTTLTVSPDGTKTSQWSYSVQESAPGKVSSETIVDPFKTSTTIALNADGTIQSQQIVDSSGTRLLRLAYTWNTTNVPLVSSITKTDDAGNQSSFALSYDGFGNITEAKESDFNGQTIRDIVPAYMGSPYSTNHIYDLLQSVLVKDAAGHVQSRTVSNYDETSPSAPPGSVVHNESVSTPRGNRTSVTRYSDAATPGGAVVRRSTYDTTGNLTVAEVDCCTKSRFNFDAASSYAYLSSVTTGADGGQLFTTGTSFNPDNGRLLTSTDENGQVTSYQYDSMFRVREVDSPPSNGTPVSHTVRYGDDTQSPTIISSRSADSTVLIQTFDGLGHLLQQDLKDGSSGSIKSSIQMQYDAIWRQMAKSNPFAPGETVLLNTITYDGLNRVTSATPPSGGGTQFNFAGNTVLITDSSGKQRKNYVDGAGRLVRVDEPGWGDALTAIDSIQFSGSRDRSKTFTTRQKCPVGEIDCQPFTTTTVYDIGKVTVTINATPYSYTYGSGDTSATVAQNLVGKINGDPSAVATAAIDPNNSSLIDFSAKAAGFQGNNITLSVTSVTSDSTDFGVNTTSFPGTATSGTFYNGEDAVSQNSPTLSSTRHLTTTYTYDVLDHLLGSMQGAVGPINGQQIPGQRRSYAYDGLGRLVSSTTPEAGTATTFYTNADGSACSINPFSICRIQDGRATVKTFRYSDPLSRVTNVSYSDSTPAVTYTYDTGGAAASALTRLTAVTDQLQNSESFSHDNRGRLRSATFNINGANYQVTYGYNPADEVTSLQYPSGRTVRADYDPIGRFTQLTDTATPGTPYLHVNSTDYDAAGQVKNLLLGNGVNGAFQYNDHLQRTLIRYFNPNAPSGTADVLNLTYEFTSPAQPNNNGQIQAMHYFTTPGTEDPTRSELFKYDPWFRLIAAQTGRVDSTPGTWSLQWAYDRLGNRLSQTLVGGNSSAYQPNFNIDTNTNHIVGFTYDGAGNLINDTANTYAYDAENRLVGVNNGAATYKYLGRLRIGKTVGATTTAYVYAGNHPLAEYVNGSLAREYVYSGSDLLATVAGSNITYHHPDHLSNRAETDASGTVVRTYGHFPFGETWYEGGTGDKRKFTTYERDAESGLDYATYRHYSPIEGRFVQQDPSTGGIQLGNPQTLNLYSYVTNDPINYSDPLGLQKICTLTNGGADEVYFCTNIGWFSSSVQIDGQSASDPFGGSGSGGFGGGIGGLIGGILGAIQNGGLPATVPGECFLGDACPSVAITGSFIPSLPWENTCTSPWISDGCGLTGSGFTRLEPHPCLKRNQAGPEGPGDCYPGLTYGSKAGIFGRNCSSLSNSAVNGVFVETASCKEGVSNQECQKELSQYTDYYNNLRLNQKQVYKVLGSNITSQMAGGAATLCLVNDRY